VIYLLSGDDEFTIRETLSELKDTVGTPDVRDVNIVTLGATVSLDELAANASTIPFLADKRMVVVDGLLGEFERGGRRADTGSDNGKKLDDWKGLPDALANVPPTTDLVFVDGRVGTSNPLFKLIQLHVHARTFAVPGPKELRQWIANRAQLEGAEIEYQAVDTLANTIGSDLQVIVSELRKLAILAWGRAITHEDIEQMVSYTREANIFSAVDAVIEGSVSVALGLVHEILQAGSPTGYILTMIGRQVRLLILAKEIGGRRLSTGEVSQRLKLSGYPLRKTLYQADRCSMERLVEIHRALLEADLAMKSTGADDELILDTLIAGIASKQRGGRPEDPRA
jgi:DNA polymerase-3 subunit delta